MNFKKQKKVSGYDLDRIASIYEQKQKQFFLDNDNDSMHATKSLK